MAQARHNSTKSLHCSMRAAAVFLIFQWFTPLKLQRPCSAGVALVDSLARASSCPVKRDVTSSRTFLFLLLFRLLDFLGRRPKYPRALR